MAPRPTLFGLIGSGIQASLSPKLHEHEAAAQGFALAYCLIDQAGVAVHPQLLPSLLDECQRQGFRGVNVTHPFKQAVLPLLDELSADARALGAVNTVVFRDGRRHGHNTDWFGFHESFRRGLPDVAIGRVGLIGAGGAGSAVAHALLKRGVESLRIFDMDIPRAEGLARSVASVFGQNRVSVARIISEAVETMDGVVNASPVGMDHHPGSPVPSHLLRRTLWVAEIVYFPLETRLLRDARAAGCRTLDGGGMAVFQAAEAFRLFTGIAPDAERMLRDFATMTLRAAPAL